MPTALIAILSIFALIFFHELGHFIFAKRYGVRVEEFGIGLPPRIFGKKVGETIYSLNWIPLGGFVKLYGEDRKINDPKSFSSKTIYQRAVILFAGIAAFFAIAFIIFSVLSAVGYRASITEEEVERRGIYNEVDIIISNVVSGSPAGEAGVMPGDILFEVEEKEIKKLKDAQEVIEDNEGEETKVGILRGGEPLFFSMIPREDPPEGEGAIGIEMDLVIEKKHPLYIAPIQGAVLTGNMTFLTVRGFGMLISSIFTEKSTLDMIGGPVAIVDIGAGTVTAGVSSFLQFLGMITIALAIFNLLPIPALDGGRLFLLGIEKIKGAPVPEKVEVGLTTVSFILLLTLMAIVTYNDIVTRWF